MIWANVIGSILKGFSLENSDFSIWFTDLLLNGYGTVRCPIIKASLILSCSKKFFEEELLFIFNVIKESQKEINDIYVI